MQPEEHQQLLGGQCVHAAVGRAHVDAAQRAAVHQQRVRQRLEAAHAPGGHVLAHARHRGGRGAELGPPMHQRQACRPRQQLERPVERRVAAAEDHQLLAGELRGVLDAVLDGAALERLRALDA